MLPGNIWRWIILDIKRKTKEKRIWLVGGLIGICVAVVSLLYFFHAEKAEAEKLIAAQSADQVKERMQSAAFKVTTSRTSKKSVKVQIAAKSDKTLLADIKNMGYTVKYQCYRSTKKDAGYKLRKTSSKNSFISTKGTKGRKYYYKARVLVYDGSELVARSALKQCRYGARTWTK